MQKNSFDVCVIGGGVIGLLTARELQSAGATVCVVEANECGKESSWAGGGIVSPLYPWRYSAPITALAQWAQQVYPALCDELFAATTIDCEFQRSGLLLLDPHDLSAAVTWAQQHSRVFQQFHSNDYLTVQPEIIKTAAQSLLFSDIAQVRNPRLMKALKIAIQQQGITLLEFSPVQRFETKKNHVTQIVTPTSTVAAQQFVLCAGAWSGSLLRELGYAPIIKPIRGQMLLFAPHCHSLRRIVLLNGRYLIPRADGRILCGSTVEDVGFDKSTTSEALDSLKESAITIMPSLASQTVERQWAGLRPASTDGVPLICAIPAFDNVYVNAGQFRNGVVLAPASARLIADIMLRRNPIVDPTPYQLIPTPTSAIYNASLEN